MNLKLTRVLEDVTGVKGLKILRAILAGQRDPVAVEAAARDLLDDLDGVVPDYVALVDPATFEPAKQAEPGQVLATAARVGGTRLLDNVIL